MDDLYLPSSRGDGRDKLWEKTMDRFNIAGRKVDDDKAIQFPLGRDKF